MRSGVAKYRSRTNRALDGFRGGFFSLAEMLAALTIGAMVMVAVLVVYGRAQHAAAAVTAKLDGSGLPGEVLQRIAEDIDRSIASGSEAKITIENKYEDGFATAKMSIKQTYMDGKNQEQTFSEIIWQSMRNFDSDATGLTIYRSYEGITLEDRLLDEQRQTWETGQGIPICEGVTFFRIQVPQGESFLDKWTSSTLPGGIVVSLSFVEPFETVQRTLDVYDDEKIARTIAIDRTRKIGFEIAPTAGGQPGDPNAAAESEAEGEEISETEPAETGELEEPSDIKRPTIPNVQTKSKK